MRTAVYAGSFDPPTLGHAEIIRRSASLFDRVVVGVGNNPAKRYRFDVDTRAGLVRELVAEIPNVEVAAFTGLLVTFASERGASVLVRGLRAISDFELEFRNGLANRDLTGIETLFMLSDPAQIFVSSSLVKEIFDHGGDVSRYVSPRVLEALRTGR